MPWDIIIVNGSREDHPPLGDRETVIAHISSAVPGLELCQPPRPPEQVLQMMPDAVRQSMLRPRLEAEYEANDLSIQFYCTDEPVIRSINAEVRGNGNPVPILAAICTPRGWSVIDVSGNSVVDLTKAEANAWDRFRKWRDRAIDTLTNDESV